MKSRNKNLKSMASLVPKATKAAPAPPKNILLLGWRPEWNGLEAGEQARRRLERHATGLREPSGEAMVCCERRDLLRRTKPLQMERPVIDSM